MRKVSAYILFDEFKRILLMKRTLDAPTDPGFWGFFGGGIKPGEQPITALKRGAREELNIVLKNIIFFKTYKQYDNRGHQIRHIFLAPLLFSLDKLKKQQKEGSDLKLFSLNDVHKTKIANNDIKIIEEAITYLNRQK